MNQEIRFATSADDVRLAWAQHGSGPPLLRVATWMTHIERDWDSPIWRQGLADLGARFTVVRYDERGCGMSDREPAELGLDRWVEDLEAVVKAAGLDRFALLGMSQAGAVATAYAARHPEQITHLILYGAYGRGQLRRNPTPQAVENVELAQSIIKLGWGRPNPVFRRVFTARFLPGGTEEQMTWYDELEAVSATPEMAARLTRARADVSVLELAPQVKTPTLVMHAVSDEVVPFEEGRLLASLIPRARFVSLQGHNHILLPEEPAWQTFLTTIESFTGARPAQVAAKVSVSTENLSTREMEVLRLVAQGYSNEEIAASLFLSVRTVERHLGHVYAKLGLSGGSARAAAVGMLPNL